MFKLLSLGRLRVSFMRSIVLFSGPQVRCEAGRRTEVVYKGTRHESHPQASVCYSLTFNYMVINDVLTFPTLGAPLIGGPWGVLVSLSPLSPGALATRSIAYGVVEGSPS